MIPVLFKANAANFSTYGIGVLADCISCEVTEERNGTYELVLQYPVTGSNYGELSSERIIKAKPMIPPMTRPSASTASPRPLIAW